ncbi:MAG: glycosyltransferase family 4 protein [Armatimonadota bacterium]|nr:MAG: glycosyltransferase family 4 protein [Armatimonadota bacterium]
MKVLILSMHYRPDQTGNGPLVGDLAEHLASQGHRVTVVCGMPFYPQRVIPQAYCGRLACRERQDGVDVFRTHVCVRPGGTLLDKVLLQASFSISCIYGLLRAGRPDVVLCVSPPFPSGLPGLLAARLWRVPFIFNVQDIFPDVVEQLGLLKRSWFTSLLHAVEKWIYRHSARVAVISPSFVSNLMRKGVPRSKLAVIYNWVDTSFIRPLPRDNDFRRDLSLDDQFVVLYSGNIGRSQSLEVLLNAAREMEQHRTLFLVVGDGTRKQSVVSKAQAMGLTNVRFLPLQPREKLPLMLAAADVSVILLREEASYTSLPSKIPTIMSSGRPLVASVGLASDAARIVAESQCGIAVPPDDPVPFVAALHALREDHALRDNCARSARRGAERLFSRQSALSAYEDLLLNVANGHS